MLPISLFGPISTCSNRFPFVSIDFHLFRSMSIFCLDRFPWREEDSQAEDSPQPNPSIHAQLAIFYLFHEEQRSCFKHFAPMNSTDTRVCPLMDGPISMSMETSVSTVAVNDGGKQDDAAAAAAAATLSTPSPPIPTGGAKPTTTSTSITNNVLDNTTNEGDDDDDDDDDMLLVTEFPPPPYYYSLASRQIQPTNTTDNHGSASSSEECLLTPPEIPYRAFRVAAKKARMEHQKRKLMEEEERRRALLLPLSSSSLELEHQGTSMKGGDDGRTKGNTKDDDDDEDNIHDDDSIDVDNPNEPLVAVFGEIVEDPTLFQGHLDDDKESRNGGSGVGGECHDPAIVRENVKRLNRDVLHGFLALVRKLAEDDPSDHRCVVMRKVWCFGSVSVHTTWVDWTTVAVTFLFRSSFSNPPILPISPPFSYRILSSQHYDITKPMRIGNCAMNSPTISF